MNSLYPEKNWHRIFAAAALGFFLAGPIATRAEMPRRKVYEIHDKQKTASIVSVEEIRNYAHRSFNSAGQQTDKPDPVLLKILSRMQDDPAQKINVTAEVPTATDKPTR